MGRFLGPSTSEIFPGPLFFDFFQNKSWHASEAGEDLSDFNGTGIFLKRSNRFLRTHAEEEEEEPTHTHICIQGIPPPPIKFQFHLGLVRTEGFCIISSLLIRAPAAPDHPDDGEEG